jgi:hypothetical protein
MIKLKSLLLTENYEDWFGKWVHYSNTPYLKINPHVPHLDIPGIYLFPLDFIPKEYWKEKLYKFDVEVPNTLKVMDLAKIKRREFISILDALGKNKENGYEKYVEYIINSKYNNPADNFWEFLQQSYMINRFKWNSDFRKILKIDAVFDDTRSIHSHEVQLIVLDPTKIKVLNVEKRSGSGFKEIQLVMARILKMLQKYKGYYIIDQPKKIRSYNEIRGFIKFSNLPENEWKNKNYRSISFTVYPRESKQKSPSEIYVSVNSTPSRSYGVGSVYRILNDDWREIDDLEKEIEWVLTNPKKYNET